MGSAFKKALKKYIVCIDMQRDLKTKGLKEIYSNKNMQRDLRGRYSIDNTKL